MGSGLTRAPRVARWRRKEGQAAMDISVRIEEASGPREARLPVAAMYNLGSATRRAEAAVPHQEEVARSGIFIAFDIPAPRIYPIATHALVTGDKVEVFGAHSSGEVEIVVLSAEGRVFVGVGSDHTDRHVEQTSILWSKQMCPNVLAPVFWPLDEMRDRWDSCVLRSWVDGRPYQDVRAGEFLPPREMLRIVRERSAFVPEGNILVFGGTIVSLAKELGYGKRWEIELEDPVGQRRIRHGYDVVDLLARMKPEFRVPIINPAEPKRPAK
jgi:4-hydroxyphenylacetate 3-monooxygenase